MFLKLHTAFGKLNTFASLQVTLVEMELVVLLTTTLLLLLAPSSRMAITWLSNSARAVRTVRQSGIILSLSTRRLYHVLDPQHPERRALGPWITARSSASFASTCMSKLYSIVAVVIHYKHASSQYSGVLEKCTCNLSSRAF